MTEQEDPGLQSIAFYITGTARATGLRDAFEKLEEVECVESLYKLSASTPTMAKIQLVSFVVLVTDSEDKSSKDLELEVRKEIEGLINIDKVSWSRLTHPIRRVLSWALNDRVEASERVG